MFHVMVSWVVMLCSVGAGYLLTFQTSMMPLSLGWSGWDGRKWHRYWPRLGRGGRCHYPIGSMKGVNWQPVLLGWEGRTSHCYHNATWHHNPENLDLENDSHSTGEEILYFYGTQKFITMFTTAFLWTLTWGRQIKYTSSHAMSSTLFNIILPYKLRSPKWSSSFRLSD
jgi:hypothetical protein